jgi:hypothetical protein
MAAEHAAKAALELGLKVFKYCKGTGGGLRLHFVPCRLPRLEVIAIKELLQFHIMDASDKT